MKAAIRLLLALLCLSAFQAQAVQINSIDVSTVFGYPESYYPGDWNRFGVLGVPYHYNLSNGETATPGAGWIPYTNAVVTSENVTTDGTIEYTFGALTNWAKGADVLFYHFGQMLSMQSPTAEYWTEGELVAASPLVLVAGLGTPTAVISGLARIVMNHADISWGIGGGYEFVSYGAKEGDVVPFSATYTLLNGATWQPGIFNQAFEYQMTGKIAFVPEPGTLLLLGCAILILAVSMRNNRRRSMLAREANA